MQTYENKELRREILKTLYLAKSASFRLKKLVDALRPTGFPDLTEVTLGAQIKYLEKKRYVEVERTRNILSGEEFELIGISVDGIDLIENNRSDVGISDGK